MRKNRGLSPVIATVLLIAIVIIIGLILFLWFRGITKESVTKFGGENIELVCDRVQFDADYNAGIFYFSNTGNVPIYDLDLEIYKNRGYESYKISKIAIDEIWPKKGITQGKSYSGNELLELRITANENTPMP